MEYLLENFLRDLLNLPASERNDLITVYQGLMQDPQLKQLAKKLSQITDDTVTPAFTKPDTLGRIHRYVDSAKQHTRKDATTGSLLPMASQFMIVRVNFAGLGSELDDLHYGIVWNEHRKRDHISIIPTTSFKPASTLETGEAFNIGNIGFLPDQTVVLMNQITSVSRKRIKAVRHYNATSGAKEIVKLSSAQQKRVMDGFRIYGLNEKSLYIKHIRDSFTDCLPKFDDPDIQYEHLHRPVIVINNTKELLVYRLYDNQQEYNLHRKPFLLTDIVRNDAIRHWVEAKAVQDPSTLAIVKERDEVRKDAYAVIQSALKAVEAASSDEVVAPRKG